MRVSRADQAEFVRVGAEPLLEQQAALQGFASVFALQHVIGLRLAEIEVSGVPGFVVGKGVIRGEQGVGFAVALDLRDLVHRLPAGAFLDIGVVEFAAGVLPVDREHQAVRQVAIVCQRQRGAARF